MVKDQNNDWALNSAIGGLDSFKAYQSTNSGDTYINASNPSGVVRVNYETGAGTGFSIYGGNSGKLYASFTATNAIQFPGLKASSGTNCMQIDSDGWITNTGAACGIGSGTVDSGSTGQIAYYSGNGTAVSGVSTVPVSAGGTGATTASEALAALAGASLVTVAAQTFAGALSAPSVNASVNKILLVTAAPYNAKCDGFTDDQTAIQAALNDALTLGYSVQFPAGKCLTSTIIWRGQPLFGAGKALTFLQGKPGQDVIQGVNGNVYATYIEGMTIQVDGSVNAAATAAGGNDTFPTRIAGTAGGLTPLSSPPIQPGQVAVVGASISAGSTALTKSGGYFASVPSEFVIGAPITVHGAGPSGGDLTTTIAAVNGNDSITLAAAASTTVSGGSIAWGDPSKVSPPWYIGNCGIAIPQPDAKVGGFNTNGAIFRDLQIEQYKAPNKGESHLRLLPPGSPERCAF
jgi:hypothetical protein